MYLFKKILFTKVVKVKSRTSSRSKIKFENLGEISSCLLKFNLIFQLFNVTYLRNMDGIGPDASIKRESREEYSKSSHSNLQNIGIGSSLTQQLL